MALSLNDRVQETCSAPGTGAVTLLGAVTGFQTFSSGVGNGNTCYYCIADQGGANWEVGLGTYSSSGNTLTRTTPYSGSAATPVDFASGVQTVFVTYPAEKKIIQDASGNVTALGTVSSGTWEGTTIAVLHGGTGATTATGSGSVVLQTSPSLTTPDLGTPTAVNLTNGTALPLTTGVSGVLPTANGGTNLSSFTANGVVYASSTSALTTGSGLQFVGSNLGVGITPSSFAVGGAIQLNNGTVFGFAGPAGNLVANGYYSGGWKYVTTNVASNYLQQAGAHIWQTAPSDTAGNAISWTQAMTLNASGNLLVGNTNGTSKITATGVVESTTGGFKFPDGTTQTTAATAGVTQAKATGINFIFSI